ncbi:nitrate- and nitrite sensing domain-containing protein [Streptomyces sp. SID2888]|uniref:sensor histidine kinase n=1 Tax=Streptomyces sp. SID2888 TaxID=2690256 RepID=UPI0013720F2A|nr:nitrate- and nitrite sensing domain-containing protein [Streptomyces sp. SID2888]MYV47033.1 histidine kinase [Streptomyces sp. SID2888]
MRAPVQKKRPRRTGKKTAPERDTSSAPAGSGRPAHVRNRLIVAVAVVAAAIAGAGAPSVIAASGQVNDSQNLVMLAGQTQDALTLAHSLADERDAVTSYVAAGRGESKAPTKQLSARVDRQIKELSAEPDLPGGLRKALAEVAAVRRAALTGKGSALEAHQAYSTALTELHALAGRLAEQMPPRAGAGAYALADLDTAVQQSAAARGLLLAALDVPRSTQTVIDPYTGLPTTTSSSSDADVKQRDALSAAAQQAVVRADAALAGFRDNAPAAAKSSYDSTVTGPEVTSAEKYLKTLTDEPTLSDSDLGLSVKKVDAALSARVDLMRGAESSLYESRSKDLAQLRDDDVTALEIQVAALGAVLLVAVGIAMAMARSLTRPLAVLRRGSARVAADPAAEEPVKFTGRNDEFAQVVRSVNALHAHAVALQQRLSSLETDRKHLVGQRQTMADERAKLRTELTGASTHLEQVRDNIHSSFVNLALRTLGLVERQLGVIEGLEEREQDPERLSTLFKLDHFATVMRRHSENLLVLAGAEHGRKHAGPVPLVDVVRAAVSEIERYDRVRIAALPPHIHVAGFAADDLSHLVAELLENATSSSPPDERIEISGWLMESGEVTLSVQDEGIGMSADRMSKLNDRLADFDPDDSYDQESGEGLGLGLYVVARLAHRHGIRVELREQQPSGVAAVVALPKSLLATAGKAGAAKGTDGAGTVSLPGAHAEANSNVLGSRSRIAAPEPQSDEDPLIAAAEQAVRKQEEAERAEGERADDAPSTSVPGEGAPVRDTGLPADHDQPAADERETEDPEAEAAEPGPETTMALLLPSPRGDEPAPVAGIPAQTSSDPYAIGPDAHERTADEGGSRPGTEPQGLREEPESPRQARNRPAAPQDPEEDSAVPQETGEEPTAQDPRTPRRTAKGLPKRTPRISAPAPAPRPRPGGVDAEALRRRLGGFHRGALEGHRDVEAEIAEKTDGTPGDLPTAPPQVAAPGTAGDVEPSGGTVEEASS